MIKFDEGDIFKEDFADENLALAYLLVHDVVFLNNMDVNASFERHMARKYKHDYGKPQWTTCVFVNCNDTFDYAVADAESVECGDHDPDSELIQLYKYCKESPNLGYAKFCALKRNRRPIKPIVKMMKDEGIWDEELEKLKNN